MLMLEEAGLSRNVSAGALNLVSLHWSRYVQFLENKCRCASQKLVWGLCLAGWDIPEAEGSLTRIYSWSLEWVQCSIWYYYSHRELVSTHLLFVPSSPFPVFSCALLRQLYPKSPFSVANRMIFLDILSQFKNQRHFQIQSDPWQCIYHIMCS